MLFLLPYMSYYSAVAPNIWGKNIASAFSFAGIPATVAYLWHGKRPLKKCSDNVRYIALPSSFSWMMGVPKLRSTILPMIIRKYIKQEGCKHSLVAPLESPYTLDREKDKVESVKQSGAKYLFTILEHPRRNAGTDIESKYQEYMRSTANLYDIVMPITTKIRDTYIEYGRTKPILLNPIVVDITRYKLMKNTDSKRLNKFLYCGNLCHQEEMTILFKEFSLVSQEYPEARLEVIGGGHSDKSTKHLLKQYREVCREYRILNSVKFTGTLLHKDVLERYEKADAFLLPRPFREYSSAGFPTKLGEYLACGKPVIAYGTGDLPLYLEDGDSAYLVMDDSPGKFAEKVMYAIEDNSSENVGRRGAEVAAQSFSIHATANRIRRFFTANPTLLSGS